MDAPSAARSRIRISLSEQRLELLEAGGSIASYAEQRCIYIHGTSEESRIGEPASHGCIRMKNDDIVELFERVEEGTLVDISE